jgi:Ca2+-binding EF-hand superfamily protein
MKTTLTTAVLVSALASAAVNAASHDLATFVLEYDLDGDGIASMEEFQKERERRFASTDVDHDGGISRDEYVDEFRARLMFSKPDAETVTRQIEQTHVRFDVLDTNHNGAISAAEFYHSGWGMFDEHDYNRDGAVSLADEAEAGGRRS